MKNKFNKKIILYAIFLFSLVLNIQVLANSINSPTKSVELKNLGSSEGSHISNFFTPKIENISVSNQNSEVKDYSINNIYPYNFTLDNKTTGYEILINNTQDGDIAYFEINQSLNSGFFSLLLLNSQQSNNTQLINYYGISPSVNTTYGEIDFTRSVSWSLIINSTFVFSSDVNRTFNFELKLFLPNNGYGFSKSITSYDYTTVNNPLNYTSINYNANFPYEIIYFKIRVEDNRRVDFTIKENNQYSNILEFSTMSLWQTDPSSSSNPPIILNDRPESDGNGSYSYSWVSKSFIQSNTLFIKIELNHPLNSVLYSSPITGNFSLTFNFEKSGYSFNSAINIQLNHTLTIDQIYSDRYTLRSFTYFKFDIVNTDVNITFFAQSKNPTVLANSKFKIYYENPNNLIMNEQSPSSDGSINRSFIPPHPGTYYIEYAPPIYPGKGEWTIGVSYVHLPSFIWSFEFILFNVFYFLALPIIFIYLKIRMNSEEINEWEINQNYSEIYKVLSKNPRLNPKMEVPYQKILLLRKNLLIRDLIIDIVPVHMDNELDSANQNVQASIGFRYKTTIDSLLSILLIIWLTIYWIINLIIFDISNQSLFPFRVADLNSVNDIVYYLIIPVSLLLLIVYFYKESYLKSIFNEIEYSINDSKVSKTINTGKMTNLDNENLLKNLAYVRVLWNQAIKAFNDKNYSLFIIRADNSVKKLIETRFQQLLGTIDEKLEFNEIIEAVRNQGFDIPSTKKIEFFRKVRNKVVHSSHMLDEKTAIETFTYYSKFLGRLGLRT